MPVARRSTHTQSDEIAALRREVRELRAAISGAPDFEGMVDRLDESDPLMPGLTMDEVRDFTVEQHIQHKEAIDALLARGPEPDRPRNGAQQEEPQQEEPPPAQRLATGQGLLNEHSAGPERTAISRESLAKMSHDEIISRHDEINQWLSRGGASQ